METGPLVAVLLTDLLHVLERVSATGAGFRSLTDAIDTTTPAARLLMQMLGSFAEFERAMIRERMRAGSAAARKRGKVVGRKPKLSPTQQAEVVRSVQTGETTQAETARLFGVHRATVYRLVAQANVFSEG